MRDLVFLQEAQNSQRSSRMLSTPCESVQICTDPDRYSRIFRIVTSQKSFAVEICHSPLPDWIAVVDESATEEAMVVPQNSQKGILDSKLS